MLNNRRWTCENQQKIDRNCNVSARREKTTIDKERHIIDELVQGEIPELIVSGLDESMQILKKECSEIRIR